MKKHTAKITSKSIEQSGLPSDYKKAIAEYIWNGFDAQASNVSILYNANEIGYLHSFSIVDNGKGIDITTIDQTFGHFLDSQKSSSYDQDSFIKGKKGKGRFSFGLFCDKATWETTYKNNEKEFLSYKIQINKESSQDFSTSDKIISKKSTTGTTVNFESFHNLTADLLDSNDFIQYLAGEFGWFLFLNKEKEYKITVNNNPIDYWSIIDDYEELTENIFQNEFKISFLRWNQKIGDKYYYYFLNDSKKEVARKHTSFNNKAVDFHHSVYVESVYFNEFAITKLDAPTLGFDEKNQTDPIYKALIGKLNKIVFEKEKQFIREQKADILIENYNQNKIFPLFKNNAYEQFRKKDLENVVKEIYCIQPKIFQGLKNDQSKTIVGFLNLLLDTDQRENVLTILENVVKLTDEERDEFVRVLRKTNLSNITSVIKFLEHRFQVVQILKLLTGELEKFTNERDHIQKIIENNYWLFGEQFHMVSADKNFEILLNNYLGHIEKEGVPKLGAKKIKIDSKNKLKRPDIFVCRQAQITDVISNEYTIEENIMVELKRPEIVIGKEQYDQVEGYLRFIIENPEFNSQLRRWKFFLVGKQVDTYIADKYESHKAKGKRFLIESIRNYEIYAMTWDDLFRIFSLRHDQFIKKLEFKESILEELALKGIILNIRSANTLTEMAKTVV